MPMQVFAKTDSGSCGKNLTWTLSEDGVLTILGRGDMDDYLEDFIPTPWKSYQERVYLIECINEKKEATEKAFEEMKMLD